MNDDLEKNLKELQRILDNHEQALIHHELVEAALNEALNRTMDWGYMIECQNIEIVKLRAERDEARRTAEYLRNTVTGVRDPYLKFEWFSWEEQHKQYD